jgi:putative FmdB family regulatory protein
LPRYDYQCTVCEYEFELIQSFKEAGSGTCPKCEGEGRRVFHAVPIIYKGSGFYTTDYGRPKAPVENGSKDTKESKTDSDSATSKASETKETKTESTAKSTSESKT